METKQPLGPRQEAWLQALESGGYSQIQGKLHDGQGYCCLGLACKLVSTEIGEDFVLSKAKVYSICEKYTGGMPPKVISLYNFVTSFGTALTENNFEEDFSALATLNDNGATFAEIAAIVRADPSLYFTAPA